MFLAVTEPGAVHSEMQSGKALGLQCEQVSALGGQRQGGVSPCGWVMCADGGTGGSEVPLSACPPPSVRGLLPIAMAIPLASLLRFARAPHRCGHHCVAPCRAEGGTPCPRSSLRERKHKRTRPLVCSTASLFSFHCIAYLVSGSIRKNVPGNTENGGDEA